MRLQFNLMQTVQSAQNIALFDGQEAHNISGFFSYINKLRHFRSPNPLFFCRVIYINKNEGFGSKNGAPKSTVFDNILPFLTPKK